jgi:hypothetical protein
VEKGDILTLVGGFLCVLIVAILANPHSFNPGIPGLSATGTSTTQTPVESTTIIPIVMNVLPNGSVISPEETTVVRTTPTPVPPAPPYRISYIQNPFIYPMVHLPDNMNRYGVSDIGLRESEEITFAYVEENRGGVTQNFSVPYDVWALNITVIATRQPQYTQFNMILCDRSTGHIIEGAQIKYPGRSYRVVQSANRDLYMVISTQNIDSFRINLETPRSYYDAARNGS